MKNTHFLHKNHLKPEYIQKKNAALRITFGILFLFFGIIATLFFGI